MTDYLTLVKGEGIFSRLDDDFNYLTILEFEEVAHNLLEKGIIEVVYIDKENYKHYKFTEYGKGVADIIDGEEK